MARDLLPERSDGRQISDLKEVEPMERDPVCDMEVDPKTAPKSEFQGRTYYFCSLGCKQAFDANPNEYANKARSVGKRS
jgi:YHS domain-containing protein